MPWFRCVLNTCADSSGDTARMSKRGADSSTWTVLPSAHAVAAISSPMKPPPTTVNVRQACSKSRMRNASAAVRSSATLDRPSGR